MVYDVTVGPLIDFRHDYIRAGKLWKSAFDVVVVSPPP